MGKDLKGRNLGEGLSQRKDGRYVGRFTDRFGVRKEFKDFNLAEVKQQLKSAKSRNELCLNVAEDDTTLDMWYQTWMRLYKCEGVRKICANTKRQYDDIFRLHISPTLGDKKLKDIKQAHILDLIAELGKKGYQYETKNKVRILMLDMLDKAMINEMLNRNAARGIKLGKKDKVEARALTKAEQTVFFECCKGTFYDNLFTLAVSTGLRPGELCALTVSDVDFKARMIDVTKTLVYQKFDGDEKKEFHVGPPKTHQSVRKVPLTDKAIESLKKQLIQREVIMSRQSAKPLKGYENLLFTTKWGTPICSQIFCDAIKKVFEEANLTRDTLEQITPFSPHAFRHTFATRCFEAGIKAKTVQMYLGHATLAMTMDLYTHLFEKHSTEEMDKLGTVMPEEENLAKAISAEMQELIPQTVTQDAVAENVEELTDNLVYFPFAK
jgi:integrase